MELKECIFILKDMNYDSRVEFINSIKEDVNDNVIISIWKSAHRTLKKGEINALKTIVKNPEYIRSLTEERLSVLKYQISSYIFSLSAENANMGLNPDLPEVKENIKCVSELHDLLNVVNKEIENRKVVEILNNYNSTLKHHL